MNLINIHLQMEIELIEHVMIKLQKKIKSIELDKDLIAEEDRVN